MESSTCINCGNPAPKIVKGRCLPCYHAWHRSGTDREAREHRKLELPEEINSRMARVILALADFDGSHALPAWILPECDALAVLISGRAD